MTARERVIAALKHETTDYTPYYIEMCSVTMQAFTEKYGVKKEEFCDYANSHLEKINYNGGEYIAENLFRDEFGAVWDRSNGNDIGHVRTFLLTKPDLSNFIMPRVDKDQIKNNTEKILNNGRNTFKMGRIGALLFERSWSLRSMEEILVDFYEEEDFVHELFARITDHNVAVINEALQYPLDGFYLGDDYGQQQGMIMGPVLWRKYIKPCLARTFAPIKKKGLPIIFHSCRNNLDILDDMVEIGLDCYHTVQPEIYNLSELKKRFSGRLAFFGAISTQQFLPYAKPDEVKAKIKETISILGVNGGYICSPTHQVPGDVPPENVMAMIEVLSGR